MSNIKHLLPEELLNVLLTFDSKDFNNVDNKLIIESKNKLDEILLLKNKDENENAEKLTQDFNLLHVSLLDQEKYYENYKNNLRILTYMGWIIKPSLDHHMKNTLTIEEIIKILTEDASLNVKYNELPQLVSFKSLPEKLELIEYNEIEPPMAMPNLLIALSAILNDII